jgi:hypothetical protein
METSERVVATIPLAGFWQEDGVPVTERVATLAGSQIKDLLHSGPVRFVVADVGLPLQWVPSRTCFDFWKTKAKRNICSTESKAPLDAYPGSYCFVASLWKYPSEGAATEPIILLEKRH